MDAHAEHELRPGGRATRGDGGLVAGIESDADSEPVRAGARRDPGRVVGRLDVEGDGVRARRRDLLEVVRRVVDHQVAVEHPAGGVDQRRDRAEHDRPIVTGGTKCPSPTSKWKMRHPAASSASICSPSRVKSAA